MPQQQFPESVYNKAKQSAEQALSAFVAASIAFFGLDPRRASLHLDVDIDMEKLEAKGSLAHPQDIEVSIYYTTDGEPTKGEPEGADYA
jgi:hypothetical protein